MYNRHLIKQVMYGHLYYSGNHGSDKRESWLRQLLCLPLAVALSQGCSGCTSVIGSGATIEGFSFASDTTAIIFYEHWEITETPTFGFGPSQGEYYLDWELKLVDVRSQKIYWSSRIDHKRPNNEILRIQQCNDSTILIRQNDEYWLWRVGNKQPQKANLNLSGEEEKRNAGCDDIWWKEGFGRISLVADKNSCSLSLLSENMEVISSVTYAHECKGFNRVSFYSRFIEASLGQCNPYASECYTYPTVVEKGESFSAMFRHDKSGNIAQIPSFWMYYGEEKRYLKFVDSLGNIARY